jgi:hypothetical protein
MTLRIFFLLLLLPFLLTGCNGEQRQRAQLDFGTTNPAETGSRFPYLYSDDGETVFMSWLARIDEEYFALEYSSLVDGSWEDPGLVHVGHDFFANWADFPSIVSLSGEPVAAHWLKKIDGGPYAYNVQISFPDETMNRWNHNTPHDDGTPTEHGFVSMLPLDRESVLAIWLDGRHTEHRAHDEYSDFDQAMTLRSAIVHRDGTVEAERVIDEAVCDCCQTDLIAVDGGAVAVYRDRTEGEIRDISLVRYDFETHEWSEPIRVHNDNWEIAGCPVNGPRVAYSGDQIAVAWYTEADENERRILIATSSDHGETFATPLQINQGYAMGRVDIDAAPDGTFYVSWMEQQNDLARIYLRKTDGNEMLTLPVLIGSTDTGRSSGFPRLVALNDGIMLAWTQTAPFYRLRTAFYQYQLDDLFVRTE